ncbi:MAG: transglutaminase-like cysteine peptidase [Pseudomonadota bacterium]
MNQMRLIMLIALVMLPAHVAATNFELMLHSLTQRFGENSVQSFHDWQAMLTNAEGLSAPEKLTRVNEFFNRRIWFKEDQQIWGVKDYWATPMETLGKGEGDCEDFAIAKYFTLLNLGFTNDQLRFMRATLRFGGEGSSVKQAHMVLAFYSAPGAEPLLLDSLVTEIFPLSRRPDLTPQYSFNNQGYWQLGPGGDGTPNVDETRHLNRWQDLLQRAHAEGFDLR